MSFQPAFSITNPIAAALTSIERARGFLDAAKLSEDWLATMRSRAFLLEAHHTTHIDGTRLTLEQAELILAGLAVPGADPDDARELLNYREAFAFVSGYLNDGGPVPDLYRAGYDFKRLFTISEYYDRDRTAFYRALQGVRDAGMALTGWLQFLSEGLATQLDEVKSRGGRAIRRDVIARRHGLTERQAVAVGHVLEEGRLTIGDFERLCPGAHRRTLQRELRQLVDAGLLRAAGATNRLHYLAGKELD